MPGPDPDPEADVAVFLGHQLQRARITAGFDTQVALAAALSYDRAVIQKAEAGKRLPTAELLTAWCEHCHLDHEMFRDLTRLARLASDPVPDWFREWLEAERQATSLSYWQPVIVPGFLQTADYARALLLAGQIDATEEAIDTMVAARLDRRLVLSRPSPPDVVAVLDEPVLRRLIGSPGIMYDQLTELAKLSVLPCVTIQVIPADVGAHAGLGGAFNLARNDNTPGMLHMDAVEGVTTQKPVLLRKAAVAFDRLRRDALPRRQSLAILQRYAEETWKTQVA